MATSSPRSNQINRTFISYGKIPCYPTKEASDSQFQMKELEKQTATLIEKCQQLTHALRQSDDKIEALQHEKLFLVQEKAELTGVLKQLQQR